MVYLSFALSVTATYLLRFFTEKTAGGWLLDTTRRTPPFIHFGQNETLNPAAHMRTW